MWIWTIIGIFEACDLSRILCSTKSFEQIFHFWNAVSMSGNQKWQYIKLLNGNRLQRTDSTVQSNDSSVCTCKLSVIPLAYWIISLWSKSDQLNVMLSAQTVNIKRPRFMWHECILVHFSFVHHLQWKSLLKYEFPYLLTIPVIICTSPE